MTAKVRWASVLIAAVVAAIVAAGYLLPESLTATSVAGSTEGEVVERTTVCPSMRSTPDGAEAVTVFVSPGASAGTGSIDGAASEPLPLPDPGRAARVGPPAPGAAISVTSGGAAAGSTASVREYLDTGDEGRGLALASCVVPRAQWWFVGVGAAQGQIDELLLANPTESPAVVSIDVFGPDGPIDVVGVGGVVVQPGQQSTVRVDSMIPAVSGATLHVSTSGGLVAASLRSTAINGLVPLGAEYLPAAAEPARSVVVPAVLAGPGERRLVITAPDEDAAVSVSYLTADGAVQPSDAAPLPVPAGYTVAIDIADDLAGAPAAVLLTSSAPVTAAVRSRLEATLPPDATGVLNRVPVADMAWTAAQVPVQRQWLLPLTGVAAAPGTVLLSSTGGATQVSVTTRAATGAMAQQTVDVAEGGLLSVAVPVTDGAASLVTIDRLGGDGQLYAAVVQAGSLETGPIAAAANGADPSIEGSTPAAYPDPRALAGG